MDRALRHAERSGDAAALLRERMRAGELTLEHIELAARLGHPVARTLCPSVALVDWPADGVDPGGMTAFGLSVRLRPSPRQRVIQHAAELCGVALGVRVAADWAERVLPIVEAAHPGDPRPRHAIAAARACAQDPSPETVTAAKVAQDKAFDAAGHHRGDPNRTLRVSADAAAYAAGAASHWLDPDDAAFEVSDCAAWAASNAGAASADPDREYEWQRLHLAAGVLGERLPAAATYG
jgi:hypothetical protein